MVKLKVGSHFASLWLDLLSDNSRRGVDVSIIAKSLWDRQGDEDRKCIRVINSTLVSSGSGTPAQLDFERNNFFLLSFFDFPHTFCLRHFTLKN